MKGQEKTVFRHHFNRTADAFLLTVIVRGEESCLTPAPAFVHAAFAAPGREEVTHDTILPADPDMLRIRQQFQRSRRCGSPVGERGKPRVNTGELASPRRVEASWLQRFDHRDADYGGKPLLPTWSGSWVATGG